MTSKIERAEAGTRLRVTEEDRQYTGVARHPLARQWMLNRLTEARDAAASATGKDLERLATEAERIAGELRSCGMKIGGDV